ncbi:MAG TPA: ABC transporter permease [Methylomirabilota bacterium]|nr:ABC transporter permease [Methylomirabilota bacterium]
MRDLIRRYGAPLAGVFVVLTAFWLLVLVILPYLYLFENSFRPYLPVVDIGGPKDVYSLNNYLTFFESPIHIYVFFVTIIYSSVVTALCFAIAYPLAYYLSKVATSAVVPTLFLLLLIPLWVSEILRSFAWFIILALKGPLNYGLMGLGIIDQPVRWMSGFRSIIIGLVYTYVLFMLFPVYNAVQSLDTNQIEAAEDLGSPWWRTHWRVILPHAKPGIASGAVTVFMLSAGSILVPTLLASTTSRWFTEIIQQWMFESQDWNTGSAYAFLLMLICTVFVTLVMRVFRVRLSDIAK